MRCSYKYRDSFGAVRHLFLFKMSLQPGGATWRGSYLVAVCNIYQNKNSLKGRAFLRNERRVGKHIIRGVGIFHLGTSHGGMGAGFCRLGLAIKASCNCTAKKYQESRFYVFLAFGERCC